MSITDNRNIYGYEYVEKKTGKRKYIIWLESGKSKVTLPIKAQSVLVTNLITDMDGGILRRENINSENGKLTILVGIDPLLIVEK